jgi:hypothetical protein
MPFSSRRWARRLILPSPRSAAPLFHPFTSAPWSGYGHASHPREEGTIRIIPWLKGCVLTVPLTLLTATPALAQGDGPFSQCRTEAQGDTDAFEVCLSQHAAELEAAYALPVNWRSRLRTYLQSHPDGWDRLEDLIDRLENRWDRAENRRDRQENRRDRWEDRQGDQVDLEDLFDRLEDRRDRTEDRWDRREAVRDRIENRWDRRH